jgi:hypothetical protein
MKLHHTAALALTGWFLMRPPLPHLNAHAIRRVNPAAPMARWTIVRTFPTQKECDAHRGDPWERCIASDDPRLKAK